MDGKTCRNRRSGIASARTGRPRVGELSSNSPAICHGARRGAQKRGRRGVATTGEKITYPRLLQRIYLCRALLIEGVVDRGVRMTERGAAADNACRDGAPGGAGLFARARAPRSRPRKPASEARREWRTDRKVRLKGASQAPWRLPALHPLVPRGKGKQGYGPAGGPKIKRPAGGALACPTPCAKQVERKFGGSTWPERR
jgi:hypothetical protein